MSWSILCHWKSRSISLKPRVAEEKGGEQGRKKNAPISATAAAHSRITHLILVLIFPPASIRALSRLRSTVRRDSLRSEDDGAVGLLASQIPSVELKGAEKRDGKRTSSWWTNSVRGATQNRRA